MGYLSKTVQELAFRGEEVPENYIYKDGYSGDTNAPVMEIPVIDIGLLGTSAEELERLKSALSTWGCFQGVNHGMTLEYLNQVREIAKQFFQLPLEEKQKYVREENDIEGYGNDMVLSEQQKLDWTDRLYLSIYPEDQRRLKFWPENPEAFRSIMYEYSLKMQSVSEVVLKAMARSLGLGENCFLEQYGEGSKLHARFNFYPICPRPDLVLGVKPHADGTAITLLLQDESVEGLQFMKANQWFKAPIIPEAVLINVGDQAEISSNGAFKSPVHRVVTNSERERISLAVFYIPDLDKEIGPFEGLIDESRPSLYRTVKNYVDIYFQYYQQGRRPMEAAKIQD
ncbi:Oxoglutarate/iron-dependent dioxygenase [Trema orientale]|uniref:Oxoglutarate/iron-dependent dioxygenase n=1 Tax=Trema orientale TaxID=63057 RepID=A0A2P5FU42_TREOI|nr:Oxoglutarate/iron-dependent dioxygenase [Trema orientale]